MFTFKNYSYCTINFFKHTRDKCKLPRTLDYWPFGIYKNICINPGLNRYVNYDLARDLRKNVAKSSGANKNENTRRMHKN